jgi:hypothetical protein
MSRITIKAKVAVIRWLIENKQWIQDNKPTQADVAKKVSQAIGIEVSISTIGEMARSGELGFDWPKPKASTDHLSRTISYAGLCARVVNLEADVASLKEQLGVK